MASIEGLLAKIKDIDTLPTYIEAKYLLIAVERRYQRDANQESWDKLCHRNRVYNVWNGKFIDALAEEIKRLDDSPMVEICAGNGKLSYHLRKIGIDMKVTDDYSYEISNEREGLVEGMDYQEALEKYRPRVVIASWTPNKSKIPADVMNFPSVNYFVHIGDLDMCGETEEIFKREDIKWESLERAQKYSIGRTDYPGAIYHSKIVLFRKIQKM